MIPTTHDQLAPILSRLLRAGLYLEEITDAIETQTIDIAVADANGNKTAASKALGIHRNTLLNKLNARRFGDLQAKHQSLLRNAHSLRREAGAVHTEIVAARRRK